MANSSVANSSVGGYHRHVLALAKRSLIKTWRTPEALIDVSVQPIILPLALRTGAAPDRPDTLVR